MLRLLNRLGYWLRHHRLEADLAEEIEFHRHMKQRELESAALPALEAATASRRALGNTMLAREDARAVWVWPWLESVWQDLAYGARNFRRQPGSTAVALLTLASAIGLNTSLFTVFTAIAFRPWPVKDPSRVVNIHSVWYAPQGAGTGGFSLTEYRFLSDHSRSFVGLIAMREIGGIRIEDGEKPATGDFVSGNYFRLLGVEMERGRGFCQKRTASTRPSRLPYSATGPGEIALAATQPSSASKSGWMAADSRLWALLRETSAALRPTVMTSGFLCQPGRSYVLTIPTSRSSCETPTIAAHPSPDVWCQALRATRLAQNSKSCISSLAPITSWTAVESY